MRPFMPADKALLVRLFEQLKSEPGEVLRRLAGLARARVLFRGCKRGERVYAFGLVCVRNEGSITLGRLTTFVRGMLPTEIICRPGATLEIGERSTFNYGASVEAHSAVHIGRRFMCASFVRICDRGREGASPITIGDDVWLAHGVVVQPGVTIGDGSVVSAGSVVSSDVPPGSLAAGNPARSVRLSHVARE